MTFHKTTKIRKTPRMSRAANAGKVWLTILWLALTLSSCMETARETDGGKSALLRLTFVPDGIRTRTLTDGESTISDINVLVFNGDGSLTGSAYASFTGGNYTMDVNTRTGDGCSVYAIANTGSAAYFKGVTTVADFKKIYVALASDPAELGNAAKTVMFGKKTGVKIDTRTAITATDNFTLTRLCTKMNFTIMPAAGITVTGYQLCHVPMGSYITDETSTAYYNPPSAVFKDFSPVTVTTSAGTNVSGINYYMYENLAGRGTNPSAETRTATYAPANATYIIVYATGPNWKSTFRIYLGGTGATDYTGYDIPRNYSYPYTIQINGSGVNDVRVTCYPELIDNPSANGWTNNGNASGVTSSATATPGDYYFSDGTWGSLANNPGKNPIAVIFSAGISGSSAYAAGYIHGLAIALTDANGGGNSYWSSTYPTSAPSGNSQNITTDNAGCNDLTSGYNGGIIDGYGKQLAESDGISYYAYYYCGNGYESNGIAANPSNNKNSGWYLPSLGEIALLWKKLGGITPSTNSSSLSNSVTPGSTNYNAFINYFTNSTVKAKVSGATAPVDKWYWSSSEYNSSYACGFLYLSSKANFGNDYKVNKNYGYYRSILAF